MHDDGQPDTGVHEIKKLAAQHREKQREQARARSRRDLTPISLPTVVVIPTRATRRRAWVLGLVAGGFLCGAAALALTLVWRSSAAREGAPAAPRVEAALSSASAPVAAEAAGPAPSAPTERGGAASPQARPLAAAQATSGSAAKARPTRARDEAEVTAPPARRAAPADKTSADPAAPASERPGPSRAASARKNGDELDQLLADSVGDGHAAKPAAAQPVAAEGDPKGLPESLGRVAITEGMARIKPRVQACYDKYLQAGIINVEVAIARTGRVSAASATGKFAGSETGACVAGAVKSAVFPRFRGASLTIDYPFMLTAP